MSARPAYMTVPHGDRTCESKRRFWCVLCHRLACWCTGASDQVDATLHEAYTAPVPTSDPGICDECWATDARGGELVAFVVSPAENAGISR